MRNWVVGGALIPRSRRRRDRTALVLVANRRRDRTIEWTPPGGVIDRGESIRQGLAREVFEETGLTVVRLGRPALLRRGRGAGTGWRLRVEAWEAADVVGDIVVADPDGIVEQCVRSPVPKRRRCWPAVRSGSTCRCGDWLNRLHAPDRSRSTSG